MVKITLEKHLDKGTKKALIKDFDESNIWSQSNHWWGNRTEKDNPSYRAKTKKDGSLRLDGIDFTDGRISTHLYFSGDKKVIDVDDRWNSDDVEAILKRKRIKYKIDR